MDIDIACNMKKKKNGVKMKSTNIHTVIAFGISTKAYNSIKLKYFKSAKDKMKIPQPIMAMQCWPIVCFLFSSLALAHAMEKEFHDLHKTIERICCHPNTRLTLIYL